MCSIFSQDIKSCRSASRIGWFRSKSVIGNTKCPKIFDRIISPFFCFLLHGLSDCLLLLAVVLPWNAGTTWKMAHTLESRGRSGKKMKQKEHKTLHWTLCLQICLWQWYSTPEPQCGAFKEKNKLDWTAWKGAATKIKLTGMDGITCSIYPMTKLLNS